jgi:3-dehydroquinate synthase
MIKKTVVEQDEREGGLRKILNFGHTFGHGIEANEGLIGLYHGECVALGMIPMCAPEIKGRLIRALSALGLPTEYSGDIDRALEYVAHDKKCRENGVECIFVDKIGTYRIEKLSLSDFNKHIKDNLL